MAKAIAPTVARAIEKKAEEVRRLAALEQAVELDRLRDEAAALQMMIAEAVRLRSLEQPFDVRGAAVFFPVLLKAEEFAGYCMVTNLAPDGMKAKVYATFSRPQPVSVHFASHELIKGTLVWSGQNEVGVRFDRVIDVARVLSSLAGKSVGIGPNRPPRLATRCLAEISDGDQCQYVEVRDISQRGAKVLTKLGRPGQKVAVQIDELDERTATVQWSRSGSAGLVFAEPLTFDDLAQFGQYGRAGN